MGAGSFELGADEKHRPVGSGKTALLLALCRALREEYNIGRSFRLPRIPIYIPQWPTSTQHDGQVADVLAVAAVTNDIFTREDQEFLIRNEALPKERIRAIETGGCPHAAIREDISANLGALEQLHAEFDPELLFIESGGDNLAGRLQIRCFVRLLILVCPPLANYSRELADYIIYVIDVSGGDKIPRKGGPGISQSDLLIINKVCLRNFLLVPFGTVTLTPETLTDRLGTLRRSFTRCDASGRSSDAGYWPDIVHRCAIGRWCRRGQAGHLGGLESQWCM